MTIAHGLPFRINAVLLTALLLVQPSVYAADNVKGQFGGSPPSKGLASTYPYASHPAQRVEATEATPKRATSTPRASWESLKTPDIQRPVMTMIKMQTIDFDKNMEKKKSEKKKLEKYTFQPLERIQMIMIEMKPMSSKMIPFRMQTPRIQTPRMRTIEPMKPMKSKIIPTPRIQPIQPMKEKKRKPIDNSAPIVPSPSGPSRPSGPSSPSGSKSPSPSAFQEYCFDYFEDSQGDWYTSEEYWSALHQRARFEGGLLDRIDRYLSTLQDEVVADADYLVDHPIDYTKDACEWIKDIAIEAADYAADLACDVADSAIYAVTDFPGFTKAALSDAKYYAGVISEDYMELQGEVMQDVKDCADEFSDFVDDIADEIENLDVKAEVESAAHNYVKIVDGMVSQAARGAKNYITFQRNLCGAVEECADDFARDYINFQEIHFQDLKNSLRNYVSFGRTSAQDMLKAMQDFFALQRSLFNLFFFGVVPTWDGGSLCADVPTEEEWCEEEEKEREEEKKKAEKNSRDLASVAASGMGGGRGGGGGGICP